jgi:hypothetical protein
MPPGNKADLSAKVVLDEVVTNWTQSRHISYRFLASATTGEGVQQAFQEFTPFLVKATGPDPDVKTILMVNQPMNHSCC